MVPLFTDKTKFLENIVSFWKNVLIHTMCSRKHAECDKDVWNSNSCPKQKSTRTFGQRHAKTKESLQLHTPSFFIWLSFYFIVNSKFWQISSTAAVVVPILNSFKWNFGMKYSLNLFRSIADPKQYFSKLWNDQGWNRRHKTENFSRLERISLSHFNL